MNLAIEKLNAQQARVPARSAPWMVAEQLKDICRAEPASAELIAKDLDNPSMSITMAEVQIKNFADKNKVGRFSCVTPIEAEEILRKFYGLPERGAQQEAENGEISFDLADLLG